MSPAERAAADAWELERISAARLVLEQLRDDVADRLSAERDATRRRRCAALLGRLSAVIRLLLELEISLDA